LSQALLAEIPDQAGAAGVVERMAITDPSSLEELDGAYDAAREDPVEESACGEVADADLHWAAGIGLRNMRTHVEGADFRRLADDVFVISVNGGQYLHEDRHLADMRDAGGFSEHTWNLVVYESEEQMLLCEVADGVFEHFEMRFEAFVYMNTVNRHMVSRKSPGARLVIVQVDGCGPGERDAAIERIRVVLASRPEPRRVGP
jgi:hypothetical protein